MYILRVILLDHGLIESRTGRVIIRVDVEYAEDTVGKAVEQMPADEAQTQAEILPPIALHYGSGIAHGLLCGKLRLIYQDKRYHQIRIQPRQAVHRYEQPQEADHSVIQPPSHNALIIREAAESVLRVQRLAAPQRQRRGAFAAGEHVREEYLIQQEYEHHSEVQRQKRQQVLRRVEAVPAECEHQRLRGEEYAHENDEIRDTHNNACTQSLCPDKSEIGAV